MRTLLISALCAILIGCSSPMPPREMVQRCTSHGCFSRTAAITPKDSKRTAFRPKPTKTAAKSKKIATSENSTAAKPPEAGAVEEKAKSGAMESDVPPSSQPSPPPNHLGAKATTGNATTTETTESRLPAETSDPVLEKAKIAVAAKMENPSSAEFADIRRPTIKNTSGQSEVICGQVKGKRK